MRTVYWDYEKHKLCAIDQRLLPQTLKIVSLATCDEVAQAIKDMTIRGAPAIGAAAAFGLALAAQDSRAKDHETLLAELQQAGERLMTARPTAVNLGWAVRRMLSAL